MIALGLHYSVLRILVVTLSTKIDIEIWNDWMIFIVMRLRNYVNYVIIAMID